MESKSWPFGVSEYEAFTLCWFFGTSEMDSAAKNIQSIRWEAPLAKTFHRHDHKTNTISATAAIRWMLLFSDRDKCLDMNGSS